MSDEQALGELRKRQLARVEELRRKPTTYDDALGRPHGSPSQVYSLRLPVECVAQLRRVADAQSVTPSALIRSWVLEKLKEMDVPKTYDDYDIGFLMAKVEAAVPAATGVYGHDDYEQLLHAKFRASRYVRERAAAAGSSALQRRAAVARTKRLISEAHVQSTYDNINKQRGPAPRLMWE